MVKKYFSFIFILIFAFTFLIGEEEEVFETSEFVDSLDFLLQDLNEFLTENEKEQLKNLYLSKDKITYRNIFEITGNQIVSSVLEKNFNRKKKFLKIEGGFNLDSLFSIKNKNFFKTTGRFNGFDFFLLTEKDFDEKKFYDNFKLGVSYQSFMFGNFTIKTGRGLFSNPNTFQKSLNRVFFSNRLELDDSYNEYPSFFGLTKIFTFKKLIITPFLSNVYYDCSLDSLGNVKKVLTYNIHKDSLSISRNNNLKEIILGMLLSSKSEFLNFATYFADYSKDMNMICSDKNFVFSAFGNISYLSYDVAFSLPNKGYSISTSLKKSTSDFTTLSGFIMNRKFFNLHSNILDEKDFYGFFFDFSKKRGVKFDNRTDFLEGDYRDFKNSTTFTFFNFLKSTFTYNFLEKEKSSMKMEFFKNYKEILSLKLTYFLNYNNSSYQKVDLFFGNKNFKISTFLYTYKIIESDYLSIFEYSFTNYYPLKVYRSGDGLVYGLNVSIKGRIKTDLGLVKNSKDFYRFYILFSCFLL